MTFAEPYTVRFLQLRCVSIGKLYGGTKRQRQGFVLVPPGSTGFIVCERIDEYRVSHWLVKFQLESRLVFVRCSPSRVAVQP